MTYQLNKDLFIENGAAVLAARARAKRLLIHEHELARKAALSPEPQPLAFKAA